MKKVPNVTMGMVPIIILVRPQMAENVGMVARAMMNCALTELRLVNPREDHLSAAAVSASSGAASVLEGAKVYPSLTEALADTHFVLATTARPREMTKPVYNPTPAMDLLQTHLTKGEKTAILFGAERTGLENDELVMADGIIEIPLNPLHCSLNLSQAVLLTGYEWFKKNHTKDNSHFETSGAAIANKGELDALLTHLETELEKRGYFRFSDKRERMSRNLRNIFARNQLTQSEIKTLHGVINDLVRKENI